MKWCSIKPAAFFIAFIHFKTYLPLLNITAIFIQRTAVMKPFLSNLRWTVNLVAAHFVSSRLFTPRLPKRQRVLRCNFLETSREPDSCLLAVNWAGGVWYILRGKKNPKQEMTSSCSKLHIKGHILTCCHTIRFFPFHAYSLVRFIRKVSRR